MIYSSIGPLLIPSLTAWLLLALTRIENKIKAGKTDAALKLINSARKTAERQQSFGYTLNMIMLLSLWRDSSLGLLIRS